MHEPVLLTHFPLETGQVYFLRSGNPGILRYRVLQCLQPCARISNAKMHRKNHAARRHSYY